MSFTLTESVVKRPALAWFEIAGWQFKKRRWNRPAANPGPKAKSSVLLRGKGEAVGMCYNFPKATRERLVESTGLRLNGDAGDAGPCRGAAPTPMASSSRRP